jgi:hydrogenase maturation protein HypF
MAATQQRRRLTVGGLVQGVGFRPFVSRLAARHGLAGSVSNGPEGVVIELEGSASALAAFEDELRPLAPPLAALATVTAVDEPPQGLEGFRILPSRTAGPAAARVPPDVATCEACLRELHDPGDRRHRYPFLNCTDCGPRWTIIEALPYDRPATVMRDFALCPACRAEYDNSADRRYHAQPVACPACGPRAWLLDAEGRPQCSDDPLAAAAELLAQGAIVALKGIGGFHLACDAADGAAVARLRQRKRRPDKPFALMVRDLEWAAALAELTDRERGLLAGWRRPILLCQPRLPLPLAPAVLGSSASIGIMLCYSPLHQLLLEGPRPVLVMTSGNRADEPLATDNHEALARLGGIADAFLLHDRPIAHAADDSVTRLSRGRPVLLRRGRGYVPQPVPLAAEGPAVLALGADLKSACCLTRAGLAFPGPCLGDLGNPDAAAQLERSARHLVRLLGAAPALLIHDLHPDFVSTRLAERLAAEWGLPLLALQHHHAHALSVLAEHGLRGPALAICLDGTGLGTDGHIWGGELLLVDGLHCRRLAHLSELPLPGGDRAAAEPWRMALAALLAAGEGAEVLPPAWQELPPFHAAPPQRVEAVLRLARQPEACPPCSSAGRHFDAAASMLGLRQTLSYEGQAAAELEDAAATSTATECYPFVWKLPAAEGPEVADTAPLFAALAEDARRGARGDAARRFHNTLVEIVCQAAQRARRAHGLGTVALSGGCFQNRLLIEGCTTALEAVGFQVLSPEQVSPNDEGISLGQAWAGLLSLKATWDHASAGEKSRR